MFCVNCAYESEEWWTTGMLPQERCGVHVKVYSAISEAVAALKPQVVVKKGILVVLGDVTLLQRCLNVLYPKEVFHYVVCKCCNIWH